MKTKRFLAAVLCAVMVAALLPTAANAFNGTAWESNDAIGICMLETGTSNISEGAENREYVYVPDDNGFSEAGADQIIYFPVDANNKVDFIAYYPQQSLIDYAMQLDLTEQSRLSAIDLMTAKTIYTAGAPHDKYHTDLEFLFSPRLAKLQVNVAADNTIASVGLSGLTVEITNQRTSCSYALLTNMLTVDSTPISTVTLHNSTDGALYEGILSPTASNMNPIVTGRQIVVTLSDNTKFYYNIPDTQNFEAGTITTINLQLSSGTNMATLTGSTNTSRGTFPATIYKTNHFTIGAVTRTGDTTATVEVSPEMSGERLSLSYTVVERGAAEPTTLGNSYETNGNTDILPLTGLTPGAKDLYITEENVGKAGTNKPLKISIPASVPVMEVDLDGTGSNAPVIYTDFAAGWNAALGADSTQASPVTVKLLADWTAVAAELTWLGSPYPTTTFGTGAGFGYDGTLGNNSGNIFVPENKHITLDLNGHKINRNGPTNPRLGNVIRVSGNLTLTDTGGNGVITGANDSAGGVLVNGTFTMDSGKITGNNGGGVYVNDNGTFNISGTAQVTGNYFGGTFTGGVLTGSTKRNVFLMTDKVINVTGALSDNASFGVTVRTTPTTDNAPVTVAQGGGTPSHTISSSDAAKFSSDAATCGLTLDSINNQLKLYPAYTVTFNKQGGTGGTDSVTATIGSAMLTVTPPTRQSYTFTGYFDATTDGTKYYNADGTSAKAWDKTADTTLYAQWTAALPTVTSVAVNPATASVAKGGSKSFTATVTGTNSPARTVTWTVEGGTASTIDASGNLSVAANETASTLTVRATSTVDTSKSGTATVTVTASPIPPDPDPIQYQVTEGQYGEWTQGSSNGLRFTANADYGKFMSVSVDNSVISSDKYTVQSGSTIVTLKAAYLSTLSVGRHTLRVNFTDGYAQTTFTVNGYIDIPKTGDSSTPTLWLGIMLMAGAGLAASLVIRRKRQNG